MKTAIDINESEFQRLKRESFEWIERMEGRGRTVPPIIHMALEAITEGSPLDKFIDNMTEEDIEKVMGVSQPESEKQLLPPQTGERGVLYEILWQHATNMTTGGESIIPCDEIDSIIDCILKEYVQINKNQ